MSLKTMYERLYPFDATISYKLILVAIAFASLLTGVLVYLLDRDPSSVYFLPESLSYFTNGNGLFGKVGGSIPTFVHVYSFILLTAIVVRPSIRSYVGISLMWLMIDSLFEVMQYSKVSAWIASYIPSWFRHIPFLENSNNYFIAGTFDWLDIYSILLGSITAFFTLLVIYLREGKSCRT